MTKSKKGTAALVGAIGSAAVAAALLYAGKRKDRKHRSAAPGSVPSGEQPETD